MHKDHHSSRRLRGALVGFGNVAVRAHLPAFLKNDHFSIEAVVDPDPARALLAAELIPKVRTYSRIEPCLQKTSLDFVDICTPPCFHTDLITTACRSGLHVFCEKPLVCSLEVIEGVGRVADASDKVIFVVNNWKHAPLWAKAIELIERGRIGKVRSVTLSVLRTPGSGGGLSDWRRSVQIAGGGILLDHGWHSIYLLLSLIKEIPLSVTARMHANGSAVEETADLTIRFQTADADLHLSARADLRRNHGIISGECGTLWVNDDHLLMAAHGDLSPERYQFSEALSAGSQHADWMAPVVEDFYREVVGLSPRGKNFTEARWCGHIIDLAYRCHRDGFPFLACEAACGEESK